MPEKIKILQSVNSLGIGGNVIFVMNYFRQINKEKFQIDFVIYDDAKMNFYDEVIKSGSKVFICKQNYKNQYLQLLSQMKQVKKILDKGHYDIIHCHSCSFIGIFRGAVPGFLTKGTKVISHAHNPGRPKHTKFDRILRYLAKKILSHISDFGFACAEECGKSKYTASFRKSEKYMIIRNAIDVKRYQFDECARVKKRKQYGIENDFVIGSVGRLEEQKNYLFLIDVLNEYLKENKQCRLLLIGDGKQKEMIMRKAQNAGIGEHIIMAGATEHPEKYYSAMDVFVLPSIYEGFGLVNIEAQVSGLVCIVSEAVPREADVSGKVNFLPYDVCKWCEALEKCKRDSVYSKRKSVYPVKYDVHREVQRLEHLYENLCS
ncbi:MAG: glycosyltransferase family 1 protein [Lachnospiraceae bacterium]|nr:glycosyltransferase family 1 protein [Lachnospiraceae bacterium]